MKEYIAILILFGSTALVTLLTIYASWIITAMITNLLYVRVIIMLLGGIQLAMIVGELFFRLVIRICRYLD